MKSKTTRRALVLSLLSLLLCCSMLVGTTFAWFTDSVTSGNNKIIAGNLDIELDYSMDLVNWNDVTNAGDIFVAPSGATKGLWEPGHTEVAYLRLTNAGTLNLKYQLRVNPFTETVGKNEAGEDIVLSEILKFVATEPSLSAPTAYTREAAQKAATEAADPVKLTEYTTGVLSMKPGDEYYIALVVYMPEEVGNEANYRGNVIPTIEFALELLATQVEAEFDSFGDDYDAEAPVAVVVNNVAELKDAIANAKDGDVIALGADITDADGLLITDKDITIDLNGKTIAVSEGGSTNSRVFLINGDSKVTVKNGTLIAEADKESGTYGTIRTEGTAQVTLENLKMYNYRGGGLNVKAVSGTTVTINNCEIYSQYGGGVEASGGNIILNNTKIDQKGVYGNGWYSVAMEINGGGKITVNSGEYSGSAIATDANAAMGNSVAFILSSGGTLTINGGEFNAVVAETAADANFCGIIYADRAAVVNINGGTFKSNGAILDMRNNTGTQPNPIATISGGTFSADPTVSGLGNSNLIKLADGYAATENADGTWTVDRDYTVITPADGTDKVANGTALADAITAGDPYVKLGAGEYKMPSISSAEEVTIVGTKDTIIDNTLGSYLDSSKVSFEGVTIKGSTGKANGNGSDYAALYSPNVTYTNCTFDGPFRVGRDGATFIGCTFTNLGNDYVWTYGNDCTFIGCTFESEGKALLIYSDGGSEVAKVTVKDCTFNATQGAKAGVIANQNCAAIEIDNYGNGVDLTTGGNTYSSNFSGEWRIKSHNGTANDVFVNGVEYTTIAIDGKLMTKDSANNVTVQ